MSSVAAAPGRPGAGPPVGGPAPGPAPGSVAAPAAGPAADVALDRRVHRVLRLPARRQRLLLADPLRPALQPALGGPAQLPVPLRDRPADLAGDPQHALADRHRGADPGHLRDRRRPRPGPGAARDRLLPDDLLPADAGAARGRDDRLRLPAEPRDGAGEHPPGQARDHGTAVVQLALLGQALARPAGDVGHRQHDDHHPGRARRRAASSPRVGAARRSGSAGSACAG